MITLTHYIYEKLRIKKASNENIFVPETLNDLATEIFKRIENCKTDILDLSYIDCSNLNSLENLFRYVRKLDIENDMSNIKVVIVYNWNVSSITNFNYCFTRLDNVEYIEGLDTWDMSNANSINGMFSNCLKLKELDLTEWELHLSEKPTFGHKYVETIFLSCHNLEKIKGLENWTFGHATILRSIFKNCKSLKTIEGIENWNVSNIKNMISIFEGMESLTRIDLSNWDTHNLETCTNFLKNNLQLISIGNISKWNVEKLFDMIGMFEGCKNLMCNISDWNINISARIVNAFKYTNSKIFKKPNVFKK